MINFSINKTYFSFNTTKRAISSKKCYSNPFTIKLMSLRKKVALSEIEQPRVSIENFISIKDENAGLLVTSPGSILLEATFLY